MNYKLLALILYVLVFAFNLMLGISNYKSRKNTIPDNVKDIYDEEAYVKFKNYTTENTLASIVFHVFSFIIAASVIFTDVIPNLMKHISDNYYTQATITTLVFGLIDFIMSLTSKFVYQMKIEEKYGFNRTTYKKFFSDQLKELILTVSLMIGLANLATVLHQTMKDWIIVFFAIIVFLFILLISFLFPIFAKLFNKFEPLEEGTLKTKLTNLLESHGFKVREIKVMKASEKTTKANAYFSGFGKMKTIVLYDTLIDVMTEDEIVAVFAHELGHGLHKDTLKMNIMSFLNVALMSVLLWLILKLTDIYTDFGFTDINYGFALILMSTVVLPFISPITSIISAAYSRKAEYKADAQAVSEGYGKELISALKVLARANMSNLSPNKLNVLLEYSHPTMSDRINAIEKLLNK